MKPRSTLFIVISLALAGCNTTETNDKKPRLHKNTWLIPETNTEPIVQDWWRIFDDPILEALIDEATLANYDIKIAQTRLREARANQDAVGGNSLPSLALDTGAQRASASENGTMPERSTPQSVYAAGFDASWEVDIFGGNRSERSAAKFSSEAVLNDQRATLIAVMAEVARNYIELRGNQRRLKILKRNIVNQEETLEIIEKRVELGLSREFDKTRALSQLRQTESLQPVLRAAIRANTYRLATLTGKAPEALTDSKIGEPGVPLNSDMVPVGLRSELLQRRPDLKAAEARLSEALANTEVAKNRLYPRFFLTGSAGLESLTFGDLLENASRNWSIGGLLQWPIFSGGRLRADVRANEARTDRAILEYERAVLNVLEEVEISIIRYAEELQTQSLLEEASASAQKSAELAGELYESGLSSFIDVLDADQRLAEAEDALIISRTRTLTQLIALYKSLGGGWEIKEELIASNTHSGLY